MARSRWTRWSMVFVFAWVVAACAGPVANEGPAAEVAFFRAEVTEIERGGAVALEWQVNNAGTRVGEPSCALLRRVEGAVWEEPIAVACTGSRSDTPPYPVDAASVTYRLRVVDGPSAGYRTSDVVVTFLAPSIAIDPVNASVLTGGTVAFTATVQGAVDASVGWAATCGSISGSGASVTFVAPPFTGPCTVTAASVADPAVRVSAVVAVGDVAIAIGPTRTTLDQGGTRTFTATVVGSADTGVVWSASEGTVTGSGASASYTAPMADGPFTVTATSAVDPTAAASAIVQVREARIVLTPISATLLSERTRTFSASLTGVADGALTWSVTGGVVAPSGAQATYTAPDAAGTYTVRVASAAQPAATASASVVVERVAIGLAPSSASILTSGTLPLVATVNGTSDLRVAWAASCGSINGTGASVAFVAPTFAGSCTVTATSVADTRRTASAAIVVTTAPSGAVVWSRTFGTEEDERPQLVATDAEGSVYVAGTTEGFLGTSLQSPFGVADGFVRKYDENGVAQWTWQFGTAAPDRVLLLEPQPNGDVIVGGAAHGSPLGDGADDTVFLARFDAASQSVAWWLEFGADVARNATAMARDAQGNLFVAASPDHLLVVKYDPAGQQLWRRLYEQEVYNGSASRMLVDALGGVVATGSSYQVEYVLRLDPDGVPLWRTRMSGLYGYFHGGRDVAIDPDGDVVYVGGGFSWSQAPSVGWVSKVDADGVEQWLRDIGPGADTSASSVAAAADGSLLVGGWSAGDLGAAGGGFGAFVTKYSGDGDRVWVRRFPNLPQQVFAAVATDGQGNGYAVATLPGVTGSGGDVFLVKMAP